MVLTVKAVLIKLKTGCKKNINDAIDFALSSPEPDTKDLKKYLFAD